MTFAYASTTVTVPAALYGDTEIVPHKWQNRIVCEDGSVKRYDRNVVEWFITVAFLCNYSKLLELRNFFKNTVRYSKLAFTFTPDAVMNAGAGLGQPVTVVLWQDEIPEPYAAPGRFPVKLILRATSSGTGNPA